MWSPPSSAREVLTQEEFDLWTLLGKTLAALGVPNPKVTTGRDAGVWGDETHTARSGGMADPSSWDPHGSARCPVGLRAAVWVVGAGLAVEDLFALAQAYGRISGRNVSPVVAGHSTLGLASSLYREFTVRDMVGWVLAGDVMGDKGEAAVARRAGMWADRGLSSGWVYAAAGLTPGEETVLGPDQAAADGCAARRDPAGRLTWATGPRSVQTAVLVTGAAPCQWWGRDRSCLLAA